jgi:type IV secretion system protein VirB8
MRKDYFEAGQNWEADAVHSLRRSERRAWFVAIAAVSVAVLLGVAVSVLTPLKRIEPILQVVDKATGESRTVGLIEQNATAVKSLTEDDAVRQSFLVRFVVARESYGTAPEIKRYFAAVKVLAERAVVEQYEADYQERYARLGDSGSRTVSVRSVSFLNATTAAVQWTAVEVDSLGTRSEDKAFVSIINFSFVRRPEELATRWDNPLGFKATKYRADQSTL